MPSFLFDPQLSSTVRDPELIANLPLSQVQWRSPRHPECWIVSLCERVPRFYRLRTTHAFFFHDVSQTHARAL